MKAAIHLKIYSASLKLKQCLVPTRILHGYGVTTVPIYTNDFSLTDDLSKKYWILS